MLLPHHIPASPYSTTTYFRLCSRLCSLPLMSMEPSATRHESKPEPPGDRRNTPHLDHLHPHLPRHRLLMFCLLHSLPTVVLPHQRSMFQGTEPSSPGGPPTPGGASGALQVNSPNKNFATSSRKVNTVRMVAHCATTAALPRCSRTMVKGFVSVLPYADERISLYKSKLQFTHYLTYIRIHSPHGSEFSLTWE